MYLTVSTLLDWLLFKKKLCQGRVYPPPTVFLSALLKFTNVCQHYLTVTGLFIAVATSSMLVTIVCTAGEVCACRGATWTNFAVLTAES